MTVETQSGQTPVQERRPPEEPVQAPPAASAGKLTVRVLLAAKLVTESTFEKDVITIGREEGCDVFLDNASVSRRHAAIVRRDGVYALLDKKTENRSLVNGKMAGEFTLLNTGDEVLVGKFSLRLEIVGGTSFSGVNFFSDSGEHDVSKLGGMTLAITSKHSARLVKERNRAKGFVVLSTGAKVFVTEAFVVGKASGCDLRLDGWFAPRRAALVVRGMDDYRLFNVAPKPDLVSVNGRPVPNVVVLADGDRIRVGDQGLTFSQGDEAAAPKPAAR